MKAPAWLELPVFAALLLAVSWPLERAVEPSFV